MIRQDRIWFHILENPMWGEARELDVYYCLGKTAAGTLPQDTLCWKCRMGPVSHMSTTSGEEACEGFCVRHLLGLWLPPSSLAAVGAGG